MKLFLAPSATPPRQKHFDVNVANFGTPRKIWIFLFRKSSDGPIMLMMDALRRSDGPIMLMMDALRIVRDLGYVALMPTISFPEVSYLQRNGMRQEKNHRLFSHALLLASCLLGGCSGAV